MRIIMLNESSGQSNVLIDCLLKNAFKIDFVSSFTQLIYALQMHSYTLIIIKQALDCRVNAKSIEKIKQTKVEIPLIIFGEFTDQSRKAIFFNNGVDDCIQLPIRDDEFLARVHAVVRRGSHTPDMIIEHGDLKLDSVAMRVYIQNKLISLTRREYSLLKYLLDNIGKPTARSKLEAELYSWEEEIESNTLVVHIYRLRKKFGNSFIKTVRGFGYMIEAKF